MMQWRYLDPASESAKVYPARLVLFLDEVLETHVHELTTTTTARCAFHRHV